jgi:hemerythrin
LGKVAADKMAIARTYTEFPSGARPCKVCGIRPFIGRQHALGHEAIDSEHLAIADWWSRTVRCEPVQFAFFVARLKRLMRNHFDHEARLMEEAGGRMCACHSREHQMLLELCDQANTLGRDRWKKAQSLLRRDLPRLMREHINTMDQLIVLFINTRGNSARRAGPLRDVCFRRSLRL